MNHIKIHSKRDVEKERKKERNEGRMLSANLKSFVKIIFQLGAMIMSSRMVLDVL